MVDVAGFGAVRLVFVFGGVCLVCHWMIGVNKKWLATAELRDELLGIAVGVETWLQNQASLHRPVHEAIWLFDCKILCDHKSDENTVNKGGGNEFASTQADSVAS